MPSDLQEDASLSPPLAPGRTGAGWPWLPALLVVLATCVVQGWGTEWPPARQFLVQRGIDLCVFGLYLREFARHSPSFLELSGLLLVTAGLLFLAYKAALGALLMIFGLSALWLVLAWLAHRWPLSRGLLTVAVFLTVLQALLSLWHALRPADGGAWFMAVVSILLLAVLALSLLSVSRSQPVRLSQQSIFHERLWAEALVLVLGAQAVLGLALRDGEADFWRTFHLLWGALSVLLALAVGWRGRLWLLRLPHRRWLVPALMIMPVNQLALGLYVRFGGEAGWLSPLHSVNGLCILAAACLVSGSLWFTQEQDFENGGA